MRAHLALLLAFAICANAWTAPTTQQPLGPVLTTARLIQGTSGGQPSVPYHIDSFDLSGSLPPDNSLEGTIWVNLTQTTSVTQYIVKAWSSSLWPAGDYTTDNPEDPNYVRRILSPFEADYFVSGNSNTGWGLVPTNSSRYAMNGNPFFDFINLPGECGRKDGTTVCRFHLAIAEQAQNCVYNLGVLVAFDNNHRALGAYAATLQSECAYYESVVFGFVDVDWVQHSLSAKNDARYRYTRWVNNWLPVKSITQLPADVWHVKHNAGSPPTIDLENNVWNNLTYPVYPSAWDYQFRVKDYGVYFNNVYYAGPTETYTGRMPASVQKNIVWPSYSTDKGAWLGLTVGSLDQAIGNNFPRTIHDLTGTSSIFDLRVTDWILEAPSHWQNVTLRMLMQMRSGHYNNTAYFFRFPDTTLIADELTWENDEFFFYRKTRDAKLWWELFTKENVPPNSTYGFTYMTSIFFVAAALVEAVTRHTLNMPLEDVHRWLVCEPLMLSDVYCTSTMKTYDEYAQVYGGYGSFIDMQSTARLMQFYVESDEGMIRNQRITTRTFFRQQLPIDPNYHGAYTNWAGARPVNNVTVFAHEYFSDGMWNSFKLARCQPANPILPDLSGFGGTRYDIGRSNTHGWANVQRQDEDRFETGFYDEAPCCYLSHLISPTNYPISAHYPTAA